MNWMGRTGMVTCGAVLAALAGAMAGGAAFAAPAAHTAREVPARWAAAPPLRIKQVGHLRDGRPVFARSDTGPTGLPPSAVEKVYSLSPTSTSGAGQIIAIVDAYRDPNALSDLNTFDAAYGLPALAACRSLSQTGACFEQAYPQGTPAVNADWAIEQSLDIEWAHAMAPGAKIVLVDAGNSGMDLYTAVSYANSLGATEVSMSWGGYEFTGEKVLDSYFAHTGTLYTASAGDSGHGVMYPAASPNVVAVGGTTLNGCAATSCTGFKSETAWAGSGGGTSVAEAEPAFQDKVQTTGKRDVPDVSFEANPSTGVSVYDSTPYGGESGWWTIGGTSVGAPSWAGILAAGASAGKTALQGDRALYPAGSANLRDITSGTNGSCGTACMAKPGYDLVTGLGSPVSYP